MRTKLPKILLLFAVLSFGASYTHPGGEFLGGALKPLSAILFIGFFMTELLKNELPKFDKDREMTLAPLRSRLSSAEPTPGEDACQDGGSADRLDAAHAFAQRQPGRAGSHNGLEQQVQRRNRRRQMAESIGDEGLPAEMADERQRNQRQPTAS